MTNKNLPDGIGTGLRITHNSGFFSCCTIALIDIIKHFNKYHELPDQVDRRQQFAFYKPDPTGHDITPLLFAEKDVRIPYYGEIVVTNEPGEISFGNYSKINFDAVSPFVNKYFSPSPTVLGVMRNMKLKYELDYDNLCAVFYRGNDKQRECDIMPYHEFIGKCNEMTIRHPGIRFLVAPDETEFAEAFISNFPDAILMEETPHMRKKNSAIFYELRGEAKTEHAINFLAATYTMARCKHVIMHSGNGAMWLSLFRGGMQNVHQFMTKHKV